MKQRDKEWGYQPSRGGIATEAKMGMMIIVILVLAFCFLVYHKFNLRQEELLAAEVKSQGQTTRTDGDSDSNISSQQIDDLQKAIEAQSGNNYRPFPDPTTNAAKDLPPSTALVSSATGSKNPPFEFDPIDSQTQPAPSPFDSFSDSEPAAASPLQEIAANNEGDFEFHASTEDSTFPTFEDASLEQPNTLNDSAINSGATFGSTAASGNPAAFASEPAFASNNLQNPNAADERTAERPVPHFENNPPAPEFAGESTFSPPVVAADTGSSVFAISDERPSEFANSVSAATEKDPFDLLMHDPATDERTTQSSTDSTTSAPDTTSPFDVDQNPPFADVSEPQLTDLDVQQSDQQNSTVLAPPTANLLTAEQQVSPFNDEPQTPTAVVDELKQTTELPQFHDAPATTAVSPTTLERSFSPETTSVADQNFGANTSLNTNRSAAAGRPTEFVSMSEFPKQDDSSQTTFDRSPVTDFSPSAQSPGSSLVPESSPAFVQESGSLPKTPNPFGDIENQNNSLADTPMLAAAEPFDVNVFERQASSVDRTTQPPPDSFPSQNDSFPTAAEPATPALPEPRSFPRIMTSPEIQTFSSSDQSPTTFAAPVTQPSPAPPRVPVQTPSREEFGSSSRQSITPQPTPDLPVTAHFMPENRPTLPQPTYNSQAPAATSLVETSPAATSPVTRSPIASHATSQTAQWDIRHARAQFAENSGSIKLASGSTVDCDLCEVRPKDTYWTISQRAYGTSMYFSSLALYNQKRIPNPKQLRPGMQVLIPPPERLQRLYPEFFKQFNRKAKQPSGYFVKADGTPAYRIGENETLSGISQKHLGRASRWIQLYRMNSRVISNPNKLKPGTVIDLPEDATNVRIAP